MIPTVVEMDNAAVKCVNIVWDLTLRQLDKILAVATEYGSKAA